METPVSAPVLTLEGFYPVVNLPSGPCILLPTAGTIKFSESMSLETVITALREQVASHEATTGSAMTAGHVRAGAGFEILSDGTLNLVLTSEGVVRRPLSVTPLAGAVPVAGEDGTLKDWLSHTAFVGQWGYFRQNPLPTGYVALDGALYAEASAKFPDLIAYLATRENELTTEADWQARSAAASGTGGVPFYVYDATANTLRMPDTRGDSPYYGTPGTWEGDATRKIKGVIGRPFTYQNRTSAPFYSSAKGGSAGGSGYAIDEISMDTSLSVPTASTNHPRRIGLTMAVYAGNAGV